MASERPAYWIVYLIGGGTVRIRAIRATVANGVLLFTDSDEERINSATGRPLTPRMGDLIEAFAPGQWLHVRMDDDRFGNSLRPSAPKP